MHDEAAVGNGLHHHAQHTPARQSLRKAAVENIPGGILSCISSRGEVAKSKINSLIIIAYTLRLTMAKSVEIKIGSIIHNSLRF